MTTTTSERVFVDKATKAQADALANKLRDMASADNCNEHQSNWLFNVAELLEQLTK